MFDKIAIRKKIFLLELKKIVLFDNPKEVNHKMYIVINVPTVKRKPEIKIVLMFEDAFMVTM